MNNECNMYQKLDRIASRQQVNAAAVQSPDGSTFHALLKV